MSARTRTCSRCSTSGLTEACPVCTEEWESRRDAAEMTPEERWAEFESWGPILEIDFSKLHKRIEELVGRPVFTHELGTSGVPYLKYEILSGEHPSFEGQLLTALAKRSAVEGRERREQREIARERCPTCRQLRKAVAAARRAAVSNFNVTLTMDAGMEINDWAVLDLTRGEAFYGAPFTTQEKLLQHLAVNLIGEGIPLSSLDGWTDLPDSAVTERVSGIEAEIEEKRSS